MASPRARKDDAPDAPPSLMAMPALGEAAQRLDAYLAQQAQQWQDAAVLRDQLTSSVYDMIAELTNLEYRRDALATQVHVQEALMAKAKADYDAEVARLDDDLVRRRDAHAAEMQELRANLQEAREALGKITGAA